MSSNTIIEEALGTESASNYYRLKQKFDRFETDNAENIELNKLRRQIAKFMARKKVEPKSDKRIDDFVKQVNKLLEEGIKRTVLLRAVREAHGKNQAESHQPKDPIAVFPEIQVMDSNGKKQPFAYYAGRRYGVRGELAQAYSQMKKRGLAFFNEHLTPFGRQWLTEVVMVGGRRGRDSGPKSPRKVNLIKIQGLFEHK